MRTTGYYSELCVVNFLELTAAEESPKWVLHREEEEKFCSYKTIRLVPRLVLY
jgi:hypothetical protein